MNASEGILTRWALLNHGIAAQHVDWLAEQFTEASLQMEELRKTIASEKARADKAEIALMNGTCAFAGPGRGDCEHFVGLPARSIPGQHDGPDDTVDVYGKPNGWCWICWWSYRTHKAEAACASLREIIHAGFPNYVIPTTCGTGWLPPEMRKVMQEALEHIAHYPVHSDPMGGAMDMQDIASKALADLKEGK